MDLDIRANIHFKHAQGAFFGSSFERHDLENYFGPYSEFDNKSSLEIGQKIQIGDEFFVVKNIKLKMLNLRNSKYHKDPDSPAEIEIWITIDNVD